MNTYIEVNGEISMEAVVEQIQQTYDMQVSGYYRQLHFVEGYLCKEKKISLETEDRKSTRLNSSHTDSSRMPSSA